MTYEIEFVHGCNLSCNFCPTSLAKETDKSYFQMTQRTMNRLLEFITDKNAVINLSLRGEATIHKYFYDYVKQIKTKFPKSFLTLFTNGDRLKNEDIIRYWDCGGDIVFMDCYSETLSERLIKFADLNPTNNSAGLFDKKNRGKRILFLSEPPQFEKNKRQAHSWVGIMNASEWFTDNFIDKNFNKYPLKKKCTYPFRQLIIRANGALDLCCLDWNGVGRLGNIFDYATDKEHIKNNPLFKQIKTMLYNKNRDFAPCDRCDYSGGPYIFNLPKEYEATNEELELIKEDLKILKHRDSVITPKMEKANEYHI